MNLDFREEDRRIKELRKQGRSEDWLKSWLKGWRLVGETR